jgi:hypothetical protein
MHLSASLKPIANILIHCDRKGWAATIKEFDDGRIIIFTPWRTWIVTRGGSVTGYDTLEYTAYLAEGKFDHENMVG